MARPVAATLNLGLGSAVAVATLAAGSLLLASDPAPVFRRVVAVVAGGLTVGLGLLQATATLLLLRERRAGHLLQLLASAPLAILLLWAFLRTQAWAVALLLLPPAALLAFPFLPSLRPRWRTRPAMR
ncbi:MAG TPA: hypothetical protein VHI93_06300 [Candidatus Thermoplasmatota archaeon]|nr:hypothetical protein [Candidatus Thermoplasmatota archaeon]